MNGASSINAPAASTAFARFPRLNRGKTSDGMTNAQAWSLAARRARYNVHALARITHVGVRQIERFCREELGRTPQDWLNEQRIIAARDLLLEFESVKRVAIELGFKQLSHFSRQFKKFYGISPSDFLSIHQQQMEAASA